MLDNTVPADTGQLKVTDLVTPLREIAHTDSHMAYHLWVLVFPIVWATLAEKKDQQVQLAKPIIQLLSKEHHSKQMHQRPNVVQVSNVVFMLLPSVQSTAATDSQLPFIHSIVGQYVICHAHTLYAITNKASHTAAVEEASQQADVLETQCCTGQQSHCPGVAAICTHIIAAIGTQHCCHSYTTLLAGPEESLCC